MRVGAELHNKAISPQHSDQLCMWQRTISSDFNILSHRYSRNVPARTVYPGAFPADTLLIQLQLKVIVTVEERMADMHLPSVLLLLCVEKV